MGSINNGINYTIGFSDNFSAPLSQFSGAVGKVALDADRLATALANLNPQLMQLKNMLSSAKGLGVLSKQLSRFAISIKEVDKAVSGKLNSRLSLLVGNLEKFEKRNATTGVSIQKTTMALEQQAVVAGALATELGAVKANMTQIPNARKFRHLARANATLTSNEATPYFLGGATTVGRTSTQRQIVAPVPMYTTMGRVGQQLRNVGQGAFQSAIAMGFMAYPFMGVGGRGVEYTKDIEKMIRDAKLRSPDVQNNKRIETDLRAYLSKTYRENPFDRDKGAEILSTLGAYGISFKSKSGGFRGSLAQKFLELNLKGVEGLDMNPTQLAKAQSYMIANAKAAGITKDDAVVKYVGDRMAYVNYLADTFGVLEKDILRGSNEKIRAAVQGISPKYNTNLDDDASAFSAWIQRGTGRNQSKATSVGTSLLNRLSQRSYLVGTSQQAGLFNEAQAQDIRSVIAQKGGLEGVRAFFKLRDANRKAVYDPFVKQGLGGFDAEGTFIRRKGLTDAQQSAISKAELSFKAREKKTIGEYGDTIGVLGSKTNLTMLDKMLNPDKEVLASKGMDRVFDILKKSLDGKLKTFNNAFDGFAGLATQALLPTLSLALDGITNFLNAMSSFMEKHPLLAKGMGATALVGAGAAVGTLGFGMMSNLAGSVIQGASLIGAGRASLRKKYFEGGRKLVSQRRENRGMMYAASTLSSGVYGFPMVNMSANKGVAKSAIRGSSTLISKVPKGGMLGGLGRSVGMGGISATIARLSASIPMLGQALAFLTNPVTQTALVIGGLATAVAFLLSPLEGWKSTMSSLGSLFVTLGTTTNLVFAQIGLALKTLMNTAYIALDSNPVTRGIIKDANMVGFGVSGGVTSLNNFLGGWNKNTALDVKTQSDLQDYGMLQYKEAKKTPLTDAERKQKNDLLWSLKNKGLAGQTSNFSAKMTQRADVADLGGRLESAKNYQSKTAIKMALLKDQYNIGNTFNPIFGKEKPNADIYNQKMKKYQNEAMYAKKMVEQIEATKAQKESALKQTMELKNNTTAITELNNTLKGMGALGITSPRSGKDPRTQPSPPTSNGGSSSAIQSIYTIGNKRVN
jgi:hypothetical protein